MSEQQNAGENISKEEFDEKIKATIEEQQKALNAFMADYQALIIKHGFKFMPELSTTKSNIQAVMHVKRVEKTPPQVKAVEPESAEEPKSE